MPVEIPLSRGYVALVDEADAERVLARRWHSSPRSNGKVYAVSVSKDEPRTVYMHRFIFGANPPRYVDHIDHDGLNNQRRNLRPSTHSANVFYRRPDIARLQNKNGFRGVKLHYRKKKYFATLIKDGLSYSRGYFTTASEAAVAWDDLALKHFGEFASLNFPRREVAA